MSIMLNLLSGQQDTLTTISFFDSASSNASTVTVPAGIQGGDIAVLIDFALNTSSTVPTSVLPTGFTLINGVASISGTNRGNARFSYKILNGTEGGSSLTGMNNDFESKVLFVFRGNVPISVASVQNAGGTIGAGTPSSRSITASGGTPPLLVLGASGGGAALTGSPAFTSTVSETYARLGYIIYNSSPANNTVTSSDAGDTNSLQTCYIELT